MSAWPDVSQDQQSYKKIDNSDKPGNDLWHGDGPIESCKAVCNANSRCKSIAHRKSDNKCWLKTYTETTGSASTNNNVDMYYKIGEPANDKKLFLREPAGPTSSWRNNGLYDTTGGCTNGAVNVGGCRTGGDDSCSWMPKAINMCPAIGETPEDLVYFRHAQIGTGKVEDYDWGAYGDTSGRYCNRFTDWGSRLSMHENAAVVCGYNRIKKDKWADLVTRYNFTQDEANRVYREHCNGEGVTSLELYNDTSYCKQFINNDTEYFGYILNKLKSESNWWNDVAKVRMFESIAKNTAARSGNESKITDVINSLPTTGWSDDIVRCLNAIMLDAGTNSTALSAITNKTKAYCLASNRDSNDKCGCFNAIDYGLDRCPANAKGCTDVVQFKNAFNQLETQSPGIAAQLKTGFTPQTDASYCRRATATDTVLAYEKPSTTPIQKTYGVCINTLANSGTVNADTIRQACNINIASGGTPSLSTTPTPSPPSGLGGLLGGGGGGDDENDEEESDNTMLWILVAILVCCCFMVIGGGVVLAMSSSN